ncbi:glutamate-cysteine ligase family protein [Streptomyces hydrogenans]|uniref:carboxylate-amine ligase n=1 Tax=Streptomyces hydrogenans TaxID=1873719 RepID=UPI003D7230DE
MFDIESGQPVPRADALPRGAERHGETFTGELPRSVVESDSGTHASPDGLFGDLTTTRARTDRAAASEGQAAVAAGTVPPARLGTVPSTDGDPRHAHLTYEYGRLGDEQLICGVHVHADVPDRDTAVRAMCVVAPCLPVLPALSASSPYGPGADTGHASRRTVVRQRRPTAGPPGCFAGAQEYDRVVDELVGSGVIGDPGTIYDDLRPPAHLPTVELRVCDASPHAETVAMTAELYPRAGGRRPRPHGDREGRLRREPRLADRGDLARGPLRTGGRTRPPADAPTRARPRRGAGDAPPAAPRPGGARRPPTVRPPTVRPSDRGGTHAKTRPSAPARHRIRLPREPSGAVRRPGGGGVPCVV